jgi:hypothetical protein
VKFLYASSLAFVCYSSVVYEREKSLSWLLTEAVRLTSEVEKLSSARLGPSFEELMGQCYKIAVSGEAINNQDETNHHKHV